jgi:hypothetical protein
MILHYTYYSLISNLSFCLLVVFYYKIAADLGDSDAQLDLANCYANGVGVKTDRFMAASYFRMASLQGKTEFGLSWIYKDKYDAFFHQKFPKHAEVEDKIRHKESNKAESPPPAKKNDNPISYLKAIQKFVPVVAVQASLTH